MLVSQEFIVYANQNLTLSCYPRDSPSDMVYWYKIDRNNKDKPEIFLSEGPSYVIANAKVNDTGIYSCSAAEWGVWGIKSGFMINVIGEVMNEINHTSYIPGRGTPEMGLPGCSSEVQS